MIKLLKSSIIIIFIIIFIILLIDILININKIENTDDEIDIDNNKISQGSQMQNINIVQISIESLKEEITFYKDKLTSILNTLNVSEQNNITLLEDNSTLSQKIKELMISIDDYQEIIDKYTI